MHRTYLLLGLIGLLSSAAWATNQDASQAARQVDLYSQRWDTLLDQIPVGTNIEVVKEKLSGVGELSEWIPLGGSGAATWIFRIDDGSRLVITTKRIASGDVISLAPTILPGTAGILFPHGTITPSGPLIVPAFGGLGAPVRRQPNLR